MELAHAGGKRRAKFTDVIERALYNGINSGMSLDGTTIAIAIPWRSIHPREKDSQPVVRHDLLSPNLERTFALLPGYFYSTSNDGIYLHLYDNLEYNWHLENGVGLKVTQKTNYPLGWND